MIMNQTEKKESNNRMNTKPKTLGELKATGYSFKSIKTELRDNLIKSLQSGTPTFPGIHGYELTVIPQ